jgi:hypothetical protein
MQITITQAEDGSLTVESDSGETYECSSVEECIGHVEQLLGGGGEQPEEMWEEEAAKRPPQLGMMA